MKKILLLTGVLLALTATCALAAGVNLGWKGATTASACPSNAAAIVDEVDFCDNTGGNFGVHTLVGSAVAPSGIVTLLGEECYVDVQVAGPVLPDYWRLDAAGCRGSSLLVGASFTGFATTVCKNYWGTSASGGFNWAPFMGGPNRGRLQMVFARPPAGAGPLTAGVEYYLFNATIDGNNAAPDPLDPNAIVCPGCQLPACLVFNEAILAQPAGVGDAILTTPAVRQFVTWQGGAGTDCPQSTPTSRTTWGQVKSLYR